MFPKTKNCKIPQNFSIKPHKEMGIEFDFKTENFSFLK